MAFKITSRVAKEFGYDVDFSFDNDSFHIMKNKQPYVTVSLSSDWYEISTFRSDEGEVINFIVVWLKKLGVSALLRSSLGDLSIKMQKVD